MSAFRLRRELRALIVLLLRTHPCGLRVLLGDVEPPEADDIRDMLCLLREDYDPEMRVDGGGDGVPEAIRLLESEERFTVIVERAGGWQHINRVCREWSAHYGSTWRVIVDHARWVKGFSRNDEPQIHRICRDHGITRETVARKIREFPGELASAIIMAPSERWDLDREKSA